MAKFTPKPLTDQVTHGRRSTYCNYGCRCDLCRSAMRAKHLATYVPTPRKQIVRKVYKCEVCGGEFHRYPSGPRTCSWACGQFLNPRVPLWAKLKWEQCWCGEWYVANRIRSHCGPQPKPARICPKCGVLPAQAGHCRGCRMVARRKEQNYRNALKRTRRRAGLDPKSTNRKRARKYGVDYEPIVNREIFERDHYRCGICGKRTLKSKQYPHPRSPTLDHIIPMALGGPHLRANVQCACLDCNVKKQTAPRGEQLRLVG